MANTVPEVIVICVDDSGWMSSPEAFQTQRDAIEHYCQAKFAEHPDTVVGLFTMGSLCPQHLLYPPTNSLTKILESVQQTYPCDDEGELDLVRALAFARLPLQPSLRLPDQKKRVVFFVGGLTNMSNEAAEDFGAIFRDTGVAVNVFNFYQGKTPKYEDDIRDSYYRYGRSELYTFFNICNCDGNSHFVDVKSESDISQLISDSLSKKAPYPCEKRKRNDNVGVLEKTPCPSEKWDDNVGELELSCKRAAV